MMRIKILLLFIGILGLTLADDDVKIPFIGPVIGTVEDAVNSTAEAVRQGEQVLIDIITADTIKKSIERFKELMVDKIDLLGLPRLEPLNITDTIDININHEIGIFNGSLNELIIINLSSFETKDVEVINGFLIPKAINLNLFINDFEISGNYDIDGIAGDLFHVFGTGPFNMTLHRIDIFVEIKKFKLLGLNHVQFGEMNVDVTLGSLTSNFTNLMGGGEPEKLFNKVIGELAPEAVDILWPEIKPNVIANIIEVVNKKLREVTILELIKLLLPSEDVKP